MLKKLLLAATITMTLHMFVRVNTSSQSNFPQGSEQNTTSPAMTTAVEVQTEPAIVPVEDWL